MVDGANQVPDDSGAQHQPEELVREVAAALAAGARLQRGRWWRI